MADLQALLAQLVQGQIDLQNHIAALAAAQPQPAPPARKKVVADPGSFDGSPAKFHEWWSKLKVWIEITMDGANDTTVAAAVYSRLTGLKAGRWAQVRLDQCMATHTALAAAPPLAPGAVPPPPAWPTRADLEAEIEGFFLPGNNQEWARAQLLRLQQGPRQRIDEFLAQFEALKIQSRCVDDYARDLLERALVMTMSNSGTYPVTPVALQHSSPTPVAHSYSGHGRADMPPLSTTLGLSSVRSLPHLAVYPALM